MITIGMPVFNDVNFLEQSLKSILNQTFYNFELIISDDGSTDGSEEICKKYASADKRITYIRQPANIGISKNMEFLYHQAKSKYFMWAGDDDILASHFIEKLISLLENNSDAISAFCTFSYIDEKNNIINGKHSYNYSNINRIKRLKNFITNANDVFGYGIFVRKEIAGVRFPVWWWPNKRCPYNNIYPSLCYYLTKGNYVHLDDDALFFKREKTSQLTNYNTSYSSNGLVDTFAFILRRFYLVCFSFKMIKKGSNIFTSLIILPSLFLHWFILSSYEQIKIATKAFLKKNKNK